MKFLTSQEPGSLHVRSTLVGSILAGLGTGAGIALLVLIAVSVSFGQTHPTNTDVIKEVVFASTIYALGGALVFATLGLTINGVTSLLSSGSLKAAAGASYVLAALSGAVFGSGLWVWQLVLTPSSGGVASLICNVALIAITGLLTAWAWVVLSSLLKIRSTDTGKSISWNLALTAGVSSLFPWAYLLVTLLVRP